MITVSRMINGIVKMWMYVEDSNYKICVECQAKYSLWNGYAVIASFQDSKQAFEWINGFTDEEVLELVKLNFEMWDMEPSMKRKIPSDKIEKIKRIVDKRVGLKES